MLIQAKPISTSGGGATTFTGLTDTFSGYSGLKLKQLMVNLAESAITTSGYRVHDITLYGAAGDAKAYADGSISNGSSTFFSASAPFTSASVDKTIVIKGAGLAGADLTTTISAYIGTTQVTLNASASTTVSSARWVFGTENTTAIQSAIDAVHAAGGGTTIVPIGNFLCTGVLNFHIYISSAVKLASTTFRGEVSGPFEPRPGAKTSPMCPMLMITNRSNYFITVNNYDVCIEDLCFYYPLQEDPLTAAAPYAYPATIFLPIVNEESRRTGINFVRRCTMVNTYIGIFTHGARCGYEDLFLGAYYCGIILDNIRDFTWIRDVLLTSSWGHIEGYSYFGGGTLTTWCSNNGYGMIARSVDQLMINGFRFFKRYCGFKFENSAEYLYGWPYNASYGDATNVHMDHVTYGIIAESVNNIVDWKFTNLSIGGQASGVSPVWLKTGGSMTPKLHWAHGAIWGTWSNPKPIVDTGSIVVIDVKGLTDTFFTFTNGDTSPSVAGLPLWKTNNSGATTITSFDGGRTGQEILIVFGDSNTTINETGNIKVIGAASITPSADDVIRFVYDGTYWREVK